MLIELVARPFCLYIYMSKQSIRWFGHIECSTGWIAKVCKLKVVAHKRHGRPKKTGDEVLVNDRKWLHVGMVSANPQVHTHLQE